MRSVLRRLSEPSTTFLMCSGRLFSPPAFEVEAELGRDHDLVADGRERLADKLFVGVGAVDLGRIEERDALFVGGANDLDALVSVGGRAVVGADAHAPGAHFRDFQLSEFSCLPWTRSSECRFPWTELMLRSTANDPTAATAPSRVVFARNSRRPRPVDFESSPQLRAFSFSMVALLLARTGRSARVVVFEGTICSLVQSLVCPRFHTLLLLSSSFDDFSGVGSHVTLNGNWPQRLAGQPRDRVGERRRQWWQAGLAHARGRIGARHDVDVELRHVGDAAPR